MEESNGEIDEPMVLWPLKLKRKVEVLRQVRRFLENEAEAEGSMWTSESSVVDGTSRGTPKAVATTCSVILVNTEPTTPKLIDIH